MLLAVMSIAIANALPQAPEQYWGYVYVEDSLVPSGTRLVVESYETGEVFVNQTLPFDNGSPGSYFFNLLFDDPMTGEDEGANVSENITFKIDGISTTIPMPGIDITEPGKVNNNFTIEGILNPELSASLSYSDNVTEIDERITVTLTLENTGHGSANAEISDISDEDWDVSGIPTALFVARDSSNSTQIRIKSSVCGDQSEDIEIEYSNLAGTTIGTISKEIEFEVKGYDIRVVSIQEEEDLVIEEDPVRVTVRVENTGDYNISSYTLRIYDNNVLIETEALNTDLDKGDYASRIYEFDDLTVGEHVITARASISEDECSESNNDASTGTITIEEKIDEQALAVQSFGNELLARIRFDKGRLARTISVDEMGVTFLLEEINDWITELEGYEETVLNTLSSDVETGKKNNSYIYISEKVDALEKEAVYSIRIVEEAEYAGNSTAVKYATENGTITSLSTEGLKAVVQLVETESLDYSKSNFTRVEISVEGNLSLENVALVIVIPETITINLSEIAYETEPEVMQELPIALSWDASSGAVYYIKKDAFDESANIRYSLVEKTSLPLIQGFAVYSGDGDDSAWKTVLIALMIVVLVSVLFTYRYNVRQNNWQPIVPRLNSLKEKFTRNKTPKAKKTVTMNELYGRFHKKEKEEAEKQAKISSFVKDEEKESEAKKPNLPELKDKVSMNELYKRFDDVRKTPAPVKTFEEKDIPKDVMEADKAFDEYDNLGSNVTYVKNLMVSGEKVEPEEAKVIQEAKQPEPEKQAEEKIEEKVKQAKTKEKKQGPTFKEIMYKVLMEGKENKIKRQVMLESVKENFSKSYGSSSGIKEIPSKLYKPKRRYRLILEKFWKKNVDDKKQSQQKEKNKK